MKNAIIIFVMKNKTTDLILLILIIALLGGFFITLNEISKIEDSIKNFKANISLEDNDQFVAPDNSTSTEKESLTPVKESDLVIPTAIIFQKKSSPLLSPQTDLTITVEKIVKEKESGIVRAYIKAFTNKADSYSALEAGNLFEIINPSGQNQKPLKVNGSFDSIPPKSSVRGEVVFKISEEKDEIILSVESNQGKIYYQFNFKDQSYEEAVLG